MLVLPTKYYKVLYIHINYIIDLKKKDSVRLFLFYRNSFKSVTFPEPTNREAMISI